MKSRELIMEKVVVGPLMVNCYVLGCPETRKGVVIDPGEDEHLVMGAIKNQDLTIEKILLTHGHIDHIAAVPELQSATGAQVYINENDSLLLEEAPNQARFLGLRIPGPCRASEFLLDNEIIRVGSLVLKTITTPGHTAGSVSFLIHNHLISGDTLFEASIGRTDLPGGSYPKIIRSIVTKLYLLPNETMVHPGHGPDTTVGYEKKHNPFTQLF